MISIKKIFNTFICHPASLIDIIINNVGEKIKVLKGLLGLMSLQYYTDWNSRDKETNDDNYLLENIQNYDDNDLLESLKDREDGDSEGNGFFGIFLNSYEKKMHL